MATGFRINPGYVYSEKMNTTPKDIQDVAKVINIFHLREKCIEYGIEKYIDQTEHTLTEFLEPYFNLPTDDLTCQFTEDGISQDATGGDPDRTIKEIIRRAFCVLVIDECFRRHLSVSMEIC